MSASVKTLKLLQAAGLTGDALLEIVASINADCGDDVHPSLLKAPPIIPRMSRRRRVSCVSESRRLEVFMRDKFICQYCDSKIMLTVDHVIPRSKGGTNDMGNLKTACKSCNSDKADLTLEEWARKRAIECRALPERKPYTLRDLRRPKLSIDAATVAEAKRLLADERRRTTRDGNVLSKARLTDRQIVEGAQRALSAARLSSAERV